jgi:hypothetical protein
MEFGKFLKSKVSMENKLSKKQKILKLKRLSKFDRFMFDGVFDFSGLGLGDEVYSLNYFLKDFAKFCRSYVPDYDIGRYDCINLEKNGLTLEHTKKVIKRLMGLPSLPYLRSFVLSKNVISINEVFDLFNDLKELSDYFCVRMGRHSTYITLRPNTFLLEGTPFPTTSSSDRYKSVCDILTSLSSVKSLKNVGICGIHWLPFIPKCHTHSFQSVHFDLSLEDVDNLSKVTIHNRKFRCIELRSCKFQTVESFHKFFEVIFKSASFTNLNMLSSTKFDCEQLQRYIFHSTSLLDFKVENLYDTDERSSFYKNIQPILTKNKWRKQTLLTACCLIIHHYKTLKLPKDVAKIISNILFLDRFNIYPLY